MCKKCYKSPALTQIRETEKIEPWVGRLRASTREKAHAFQPVKVSSNQDVGELGRGRVPLRTVVSEKAEGYMLA